MKTTSLFQIFAASAMATSVQGFQSTAPFGHSSQMISSTTSLNMEAQENMGRRQAMAAVLGGSFAVFSAVQSSNALDMDAFMNSELESDTKNCDPKRDPKCVPKLSADEALCKYGQSGEARGEACKRVKKAGGELPSAQSQGKSLGGAYAM